MPCSGDRHHGRLRSGERRWHRRSRSASVPYTTSAPGWPGHRPRHEPSSSSAPTKSLNQADKRTAGTPSVLARVELLTDNVDARRFIHRRDRLAPIINAGRSCHHRECRHRAHHQHVHFLVRTSFTMWQSGCPARSPPNSWARPRSSFHTDFPPVRRLAAFGALRGRRRRASAT